MNSYVFKQLSARHTNFSTNCLHLDYRLSSDCLFTSVEICLDYLNKICFNIPINLDNKILDSYLEYPIIYVNIIDESICSMIYQAFQLQKNNSSDLLAYYRNKIDNFISLLQNIDFAKAKIDSQIVSALIVCLTKVSVLFNPTTIIEEVSFGELALFYYNLLYTIYTKLSNGPEEKYMVKCKNLYKMYIEQSYKQYAPMTLSNNIYRGDSIYVQ